MHPTGKAHHKEVLQQPRGIADGNRPEAFSSHVRGARASVPTSRASPKGRPCIPTMLPAPALLPKQACPEPRVLYKIPSEYQGLLLKTNKLRKPNFLHTRLFKSISLNQIKQFRNAELVLVLMEMVTTVYKTDHH